MLVAVLRGARSVKRSLSAVTLGAVAGVVVVVLSGCSMVSGVSSRASQVIPSSIPTATAGPPSPVAPQQPTPSPSSTAAAAAPTPANVPGYTLGAPKSDVHRKFQTVAGQFTGVFSGITSRTVVKGQRQVGSLVLLSLHSDLVGNMQVEQRLVPGMVRGMSGQGAKVTQQKIGNHSVAVAKTKSTNIVAWYRSGAVVLVLGNGTDPAQSLAFTKSYLAAS
jgi:hypothetical protein